MIDKLRNIAIFCNVVEKGTFRGAAQHLNLAPSRISESVSQLEKDLGVTLLYRSTRQLSLTDKGRMLFENAQQMLKAAETGLDAINPSSIEARGSLKITAPAFTIQTSLLDAIADFSKTHKNVQLDLDFSDRPRDLIRDGFDVGIRAGWLKDSELLTRNIGQAARLLVASPEYVNAQPPAQHPSDLENWEWIRFFVRANQTEFTSTTGQKVSVTGKSVIKVNSADALYECALRSLGVTAIPDTLAHRGFDRGDLVHVLPEWTLDPLGFHAVWPGSARRENLTLLFVRHLADAYKTAKQRD